MDSITIPGRYLLMGKSRSGKTTLAVELYEACFEGKTDRIIMICPSYDQETYAPIRKHVNEKRDVFTDDDPDVIKTIVKQIETTRKLCIEKRMKIPHTLVIIDDMSGAKISHGGRHSPFANFTVRCNHLNTSIMFLAQQATGVTPTFRDNLEGLICFPTLRSKDREWLYNEYNAMMKKKTFLRLVKKAWKGVGRDDMEEWGEHFLFITFPTRKKPRYFGDFKYELSTTRHDLKSHHK